MSEPIVYVDRSTVRDGKLEPLQEAMRDLARFVEEEQPQVLAFNAYFGDDGTRMTVIHVHRDAASLDRYLERAGPRFPQFADFVRLTGIEVYGKPSAEAMERLRRKADDLGGGTVAVHAHGAGFARVGQG